MLLGSFAITGIAVTFAREILFLAQGNLIAMILLSALASLIMGTGMPLIACYVFLAIVMAPALITAGLNTLAVHLFLMYCGTLAYITPPVAIASFPASVLSGAPAMKVAATACRLGGVIFILPFFFVLDPSLILEGGVGEILQSTGTALLGVFLIGSAFEGYMMGLGRLWPAWKIGYLFRSGLILSGVLLGLPGWRLDILGVILAALILSPLLFRAIFRFGRREVLTG
jgi:TRAP-type uncharacterized transport system fused permease subunit